VRLVVETMNAVIAANGGPPLHTKESESSPGQPLDGIRLAWPDIVAADVDRYRVEYRARYAEQSVRTWPELRRAVSALSWPKPGILGRRGPLRS
jgi:hypothetical protein